MSHSIETRCIHGDVHKFREDSRAISFPIYQTASFSHIEPGHNGSGFDYTRESNPTRSRVEETVASLEGAADAIAFSSGMAAISACFELFRPGDHIICSEDLYGGTVRLFHNISEKNGLIIQFVDTTDLDIVRAALRPNTRAIYVETPSNPMMNVTDLAGCAALAKAAGALLIADNTFLSPYFQNPIALGADIVLHSGSKFLGGHNDTISGFLCAADQDLADRVRLISKTIGNTLSPFDSWLVLRGIKTLAVRMERQQQTALTLARWLSEQSWVKQVYHIGLPDHPGYAVNARQSRGCGSTFSFSVDSRETALKILEGVSLITFAESLGGTESLITYPLVQTHPDVPAEVREHLGITDTLLRLSVGLEHEDDLIADLKAAAEG
ncbi:MAG: aminotransferase class V-fold PLP-dependent enzyme [Oscillospiraceae bacterium]|nr:aminotransferase class V-fold PLP-dependent enzyme [Oscillospiraceae bacterium]